VQRQYMSIDINDDIVSQSQWQGGIRPPLSQNLWTDDH